MQNLKFQCALYLLYNYKPSLRQAVIWNMTSQTELAEVASPGLVLGTSCWQQRTFRWRMVRSTRPLWQS